MTRDRKHFEDITWRLLSSSFDSLLSTTTESSTGLILKMLSQKKIPDFYPAIRNALRKISKTRNFFAASFCHSYERLCWMKHLPQDRHTKPPITFPNFKKLRHKIMHNQSLGDGKLMDKVLYDILFQTVHIELTLHLETTCFKISQKSGNHIHAWDVIDIFFSSSSRTRNIEKMEVNLMLFNSLYL